MKKESKKVKEAPAKETVAQETPIAVGSVSRDEGKGKEFPDYEVDNAADTLLRAEEIKSNSELMAHVNKKLSKKQKQIKSIKDIKDARDAMSKDDDDADDA